MGNGDWISRPRVAALALAACLALAGCTAAAPTPQIIYVTPPPTPIIIYVTPPPTPIIIYVTPPPTPTPVVTPSPEVITTPTPTATPTPSPAPSPTSPAAACTGTTSNNALFAQAAGAMNWTVYCAVLPSGWHVYKGGYDYAPDGLLDVEYQGPGTSWLTLIEGNICGHGGFCAWQSMGVDQGPAAFDHLAAELWVRTANPAFVAIDANYGSAHEYLIHTVDVSQTTTKAFAAAMIAVPR
jgi:hypothetical protein